MNTHSKRFLYILGPIVCFAILLLGAIEFALEPSYNIAIKTMLRTAVVAFPLLTLAIYFLNKQQAEQIEDLRESIAQSTKEERTRSQNILEGTEAGTWDWNLLTGELVLNERWAEIIGYTLEELEPINFETWENSVHPKDKERATELIQQHFKGTLPYYDIQLRQRHKDGNWRWVNARGKIIKWTEDGTPLRMSGTHMDITDKKHAEEANESSRKLLQNVFNATSGVSVIATDQSGIITLFNSGAEQMLGYLADELIGQTTPFIFHLKSELEARGIALENAQAATPSGYMEKVLAVGKENPEWTYRCKDGSLFPVKISITSTYNDAGKLTGYLGVAMDISTRKQAELELKESRRILRKILDTIPVRVFWKDVNSVYLGGNKLFADDAGKQTADELIGLTDFDMSWPDQADAFRADDAEVIQTGRAKLNFEEPQSRPDESVNWLKTSKIPLRNEVNEVIGVLGTYEDITTIKQAQEDLIHAKETAEAASKAKDEFLAVMSHEIRTPLNPILGFAEMLKYSISTKPELEYIDTIIQSANRQLRLIDDILDYMRINSSQVEMKPEQFSLVDLCEMVVNDAHAIAGSLQLKFCNGPAGCSVPDDLIVDADLMMMRRILDNLINNACKYTLDGTITLNLSRSPDDSGMFIISVTDTGIGISEHDQQKLFNAFSQADSSYTRKHEGLGLGLAICKKLVSILGGEIDVESQYGQGSTFTVHLALKVHIDRYSIQNTKKTPQSKNQFKQRYNILITDDQSDNRLITRLLIESFGGHVTEAANGQEAVHLCSEKKFDMILMDLAMPVMDGNEATRNIRNPQSINHTTPIIAVTADVTPHARKACISAGMQQRITKPIDSQNLFDLIEKYTTSS